MRTIVLAMLLAGCVNHPVEYVPFEVNVPVPVPCAVDAGKEPDHATAALRAADTLDEKVKAVLADLQRQQSYIEKLKAANAGCR